jgi:hypothetical protein
MLSTTPTPQNRASCACVRGLKTRVWGFCRRPTTRAPVFGLQTTKPRRVAKVAATKTASGPSLWLSRDPIGEKDGPNIYAYVRNDPVNRIDPLGLWNLWNPFTYGLPSNPGENPWNPVDSSAEWGAMRDGAMRPFDMPQEAMDYGDRNRGCNGNDSDHHAIAVRRYGELVEDQYGFLAGAFGAYAAGVAGNIGEVLAPSSDWSSDLDANSQGYMDYLEQNRYPGER